VRQVGQLPRSILQVTIAHNYGHIS